MSQEIKLSVRLYRYVSTPSAIQGEPHYALFTYETSSSDWLFVKELEVIATDDTSMDELIQGTVANIDKAIRTKRLDLEEEIAELTKQKQELLSLAYTV
jgi:hypothetical protein